MDVGFPFRVDSRGFIDSPNHAVHVEQLIEQLLFTSPGERVNRPTFGSGLLELLFDAASEEEAAATEHLAQAELEQWLGELIDVELVQVTPAGETETVLVQYVLRTTGEQMVSRFQRGLGLRPP